MMDILDLLADKHQIRYQLIFNSKEGLNEADGGHIVISPYSFKVERFLTFDYGLSNEVLFNDRPQGTARAYYKHQLEKNFLEKPGEKDITCHLSWDELKKSLKANSFESINLENQETFFMHHAQKKMKSLFDEKKRNSDFDLNSLKEIINPHYFGSKFQALWAIRR